MALLMMLGRCNILSKKCPVKILQHSLLFFLWYLLSHAMRPAPHSYDLQ